MIGAISQRLAGGTEAEPVPADGVDTGVDDGGVSEPVGEDDIGLARELVVNQLQDAEDRFDVAWETEGDLQGSVDALTERHGWRTALTALENYESERSDPDRLEFRVDSRTLREAYDAVFAEPDVESIVYLSGLALADGVRTINRVLEFEHAEQSAVKAVGDSESQFAALDRLEATGHQLLGTFHNHPGTGVAGTQPSATDLSYQADLEALGYDAVGFIVTEDGWLRAYSENQPFAVEVHGAGITTHDRHERVFHLEDV